LDKIQRAPVTEEKQRFLKEQSIIAFRIAKKDETLKQLASSLRFESGLALIDAFKNVGSPKRLIAAGADFTVCDEEGKMALDFSKDKATSRMILDKIRDSSLPAAEKLSLSLHHSGTALIAACKEGDLEKASQLIQAEADTSFINDEGMTALFWANQHENLHALIPEIKKGLYHE
jgi:ankyrin repeat protein